ncbi:MAG: hypothetical protein JWO86_2394 [Myxococcaceae bacterium]|nr:hypothetical protein [Myxococcaceae bacterium]
MPLCPPPRPRTFEPFYDRAGMRKTFCAPLQRSRGAETTGGSRAAAIPGRTASKIARARAAHDSQSTLAAALCAVEVENGLMNRRVSAESSGPSYPSRLRHANGTVSTHYLRATGGSTSSMRCAAVALIFRPARRRPRRRRAWRGCPPPPGRGSSPPVFDARRRQRPAGRPANSKPRAKGSSLQSRDVALSAAWLGQSAPGAGHLVAVLRACASGPYVGDFVDRRPVVGRARPATGRDLPHIASINTSRSFAPFDGPTRPRFSIVSTIRAARL